MKFTKATKENKVTITLGERILYIRGCSDHPKDLQIRIEIRNRGYHLTGTYGPCNKDTGYTVTGGTPEELKQIERELKVAYGLVEEVEDVELLSRIAIEIAIGAAKTNDRRQRLTNENFPPGFDVVKAAQTDGFMRVCLETARSILEILK